MAVISHCASEQVWFQFSLQFLLRVAAFIDSPSVGPIVSPLYVSGKNSLEHQMP